MYSVKIDEEKCIGCGLCSEICQEIFKMDGDIAVVKKSRTDKPCVNEAKDGCPTEAIIVK